MPIDRNNVQIPFCWYSAFDPKAHKLVKPSTLTPSRDDWYNILLLITHPPLKATSYHADFEKGHVLFNIAAMYNQLGNAVDRSNLDGIKKALHYYQVRGLLFQGDNLSG